MKRYATLILVCVIATLVYMRVTRTDDSDLSYQERVAKELYLPDVQIAAYSDNDVVYVYVNQDTRPARGQYTCGGLPQTEAQQAAQKVESALQYLPNKSWEHIDLRYVLLCSYAKSKEREIGGIPVPPLKLLMLSTGNRHSGRLEHRTLHELYHMIEFQHNSYEDDDWLHTFTGYTNRYSNNTDITFGSGGKGFINAYGLQYAHEERAELFAFLHLTPTTLQSYIRQSNDLTLLSKVKHLQQKCQTMLGPNGC